MAVHASSVIDVSINTFDSALYTAITDKEEYCYDSSTQPDVVGDGVDEYSPFFTSLSNAIVAWLTTPRTYDFKNYFQTLYSYIALYKLYNANPSLYNNIHADDIFTMSGYIARIKTDPVDYYDDFYTDAIEPFENHAPNLEADTSLIASSYNNADPLDPESSAMDSNASSAQNTVENQLYTLLFNDITPLDTVTKVTMRGFIFDSGAGSLNYEYWLNQFGNTSDIP